MARSTTVRVLLAIEAVIQWHAHPVDMNNGYLHGHIEEDIYLLTTKGYHKVGNGEVCKLVKLLYGPE